MLGSCYLVEELLSQENKYSEAAATDEKSIMPQVELNGWLV